MYFIGAADEHSEKFVMSVQTTGPASNLHLVATFDLISRVETFFA